MDNTYKLKYLKYKEKYIKLKNQLGSAPPLSKFNKNIDDGNAHIKPTVQNIVLNYGPQDPNFMMPEGVVLAGEVSDYSLSTQSGTWCPLIWRALAKCQDIPDKLKNSYQSNVEKIGVDKFNDVVDRLSKIPGWCDYAKKVLTHDFGSIPKGSNDFYHPYVQGKTRELSR